MQNVITIISNPEDIKLDEGFINKIFIQLEKKAAKVASFKWLSIGEACDIFFEGGDTKALLERLKEKFVDVKVDFIIQKAENRRKKMLISDMDSTIINQECIDELADVLGIKEKISHITERAMNGELDFKAALRERVSLLKGLKEEDLQKVYDRQISLMDGAKQLVTTMRAHGGFCVLVSGGFTFFTDRIAGQVGFDKNEANILEIKDGKLTGNVIEPILDKDTKLKFLNQYAEKLGITVDDVLAVGDGANDLPMLLGAGLGIAYHAKPVVCAQAKFEVVHTGLKSLLYAQGYKEEEITGDK